MKTHGFYVDEQVLSKAKTKAQKEARSLSAVVNKLLKMWTKGEVKF